MRLRFNDVENKCNFDVLISYIKGKSIVIFDLGL